MDYMSSQLIELNNLYVCIQQLEVTFYNIAHSHHLHAFHIFHHLYFHNLNVN